MLQLPQQQCLEPEATTVEKKDLEAFCCLAEQLHFSRAAGLLHMTPSTLSRMIQRLESEVGKPLFLRDKRKVQLTGAGQAFKHYAEESLNLWVDFQSTLYGNQVPDGKVKIFCSVTASYSLLSQILPQVRVKYPQIELNVFTGDQADAIPKVLEGVHDLSVATRPQVMPSELAFQPITEASLLLIAPTVDCDVVNILNTTKETDWNSLPFIVAEHGVSRQRLETWWQTEGLRPPVYAYVGGHEAVVNMVALGFGVALVPDIVVRHSPQGEHVQVLPLPFELPVLEIGLCARHDSLDVKVVRALWDLAALAVHTRKT